MARVTRECAPTYQTPGATDMRPERGVGVRWFFFQCQTVTWGDGMPWQAATWRQENAHPADSSGTSCLMTSIQRPWRWAECARLRAHSARSHSTSKFERSLEFAETLNPRCACLCTVRSTRQRHRLRAFTAAHLPEIRVLHAHACMWLGHKVLPISSYHGMSLPHVTLGDFRLCKRPKAFVYSNLRHHPPRMRLHQPCTHVRMIAPS